MVSILNFVTLLSFSAFQTVICFSPFGSSARAYTVPPLPSSTALSSTKEKREPWDFVRFVRQSSKFVSLPKFTPPSKPTSIQPNDVLWTPSSSPSSSQPFTWGPLDDVVMGGVSSSTFDNQNGSWKGYVTDKNSGGFVGIRTTPFQTALDMSSCSGIEFTLSGVDVGKKQFKAVARDSTDFNGVCWTVTFGGGSKWGLWGSSNIGGGGGGGRETQTKVKIPFSEMVPTIFAKTVPDQSLKKDNIVGFQLVYSKFLYDGDLNPDFAVGDFEVRVNEVKAY